MFECENGALFALEDVVSVLPDEESSKKHPRWYVYFRRVAVQRSFWVTISETDYQRLVKVLKKGKKII